MITYLTLHSNLIGNNELNKMGIGFIGTTERYENTSAGCHPTASGPAAQNSPTETIK